MPILDFQTPDPADATTPKPALSRHNSFTILDPASGIPSDLGTPKLQVLRLLLHFTTYY
jgi:hypothetical protein